MDILDNPFCILGITPKELVPHKLEQLLKERLGSQHYNIYAKAKEELDYASTRLFCEIAYLPKVDPEEAAKLIYALKYPPVSEKPIDILEFYPRKVSLMGKVNYLTSALAHHWYRGIPSIPKVIAKIALDFELVNSSMLMEEINEDRAQVLYEKVKDSFLIDRYLMQLRKYYSAIIISILDHLPSQEIINQVTKIYKFFMSDSEKTLPKLILDIIADFEVRAQGFLKYEERNIRTLNLVLLKALSESEPTPKINFIVAMLLDVMKNWHKVMWPIQSRSKKYNVFHSRVKKIAEEVLETFQVISSKHNQHRLAVELIQKTLKFWAPIKELQDQFESEAEAIIKLTGIKVPKRTIDFALPTGNDIDRYFSAFVGLKSFFKLEIDGKSVKFRGITLPITSIFRVRWGRVFQSDGENTSVYKFILGSSHNNIVFELYDPVLYETLVEKLQKLVMPHILKEYLKGFSLGEKFSFGSLYVFDDGVEIEIQADEKTVTQHNYSWTEIEILEDPYSLILSTKGSQGYTLEIPFLKEDNIPVLKMLIQYLKEENLNKLSDLERKNRY